MSELFNRIKEAIKEQITLFDLEPSLKPGLNKAPYREDNDPSLSVTPNGKGWKDFGRPEYKGDVISYKAIQMGMGPRPKGTDYRKVITELSKLANIPIQRITSEESKSIEKSREEELIVEQVHEAACKFFATQLDKSGNKKYFIDRGIHDETITQYRLGWAPGGSVLLQHLRSLGFDDPQLLLSGLFIQGNQSIFPLFKNRYIIPYLVNDAPKYFIGREAPATQDKMGKYVKCITKSEKHPYVSVVVQNKHLYGIDSVQDGEPLLITEGIMDALTLLQLGYCSISPGTVQFRNQDTRAIVGAAKRSSQIYIINDVEESGAGEAGALAIAETLFDRGIFNVNLVSLSLDEGKKKVDVNDALANKDELESKSIVQEWMNSSTLHIDALLSRLNWQCNDLQKANNLETACQIIARLPLSAQGVYIGKLKKVSGVTVQTIKKILDTIQKELKDVQVNDEPIIKPVLDPIFKDPELLKHIHKEVDKFHLLDHREKMAGFVIALTAELPNPKDRKSGAAVGGSSAGKDNLWASVLKLFPKKDSIWYTDSSPSAFRDTVHKAKRVVLSEVNLATEGGANAQLREKIKQLAEGGISDSIKEPKGRGWETVNINVEQKTVCYSTTEAAIDEEVHTRYTVIPIRSDKYKNQLVTNNVLANASDPEKMLAQQEEETWVAKSIPALDTFDVICPYLDLLKGPIEAPDGSKKILFDFTKERIKRDVKRLVSYTKAIAFLHQRQRHIIDFEDMQLIVSEPSDFVAALTIFGSFIDFTYAGLDHRSTKALDALKTLSGNKDDEVSKAGYKLDFLGAGWVPRHIIQNEIGVADQKTIKKYIQQLQDRNLVDTHYERGVVPGGVLVRPRNQGRNWVALRRDSEAVLIHLQAFLTPENMNKWYDNKKIVPIDCSFLDSYISEDEERGKQAHRQEDIPNQKIPNQKKEETATKNIQREPTRKTLHKVMKRLHREQKCLTPKEILNELSKYMGYQQTTIDQIEALIKKYLDDFYFHKAGTYTLKENLSTSDSSRE